MRAVIVNRAAMEKSLSSNFHLDVLPSRGLRIGGLQMRASSLLLGHNPVSPLDMAIDPRTIPV